MSWFKKLIAGDDPSSQGPRFGFQILKNANPNLQVEPWFDFCVGLNHRIIEDGNSYLFSQEIRNCAGRDVSLTVWSAKGQRTRDVILRIPADYQSLGLALQWAPLSVTDQIWHILDVAAQSPADMAGLLPYSDYIIGSPEYMLRGESSLYELVEEHIDRPLRLIVYNQEYDVTRELTITPSRRWGGDGMLGCVLGFGALHRLPAPLHEPIQAPGETLFDSDQFPPTEPQGLLGTRTPTQSHPQYPPPSTFASPPPAGPPKGDFITPAMTAGTPPPPPPSGHAHGRHKPRRQVHSVLDMDDYLKEGEQKSKELDGRGTATGAKGLPPPPKGAPPPPRRGETPGGAVSSPPPAPAEEEAS